MLHVIKNNGSDAVPCCTVPDLSPTVICPLKCGTVLCNYTSVQVQYAVAMGTTGNLC